MSNPKEVAKSLLKTAQEHRVRFPKIWDETKLIQECGGILMANRTDGVFDEQAALEALKVKHGVEKASTDADSALSMEVAESKKRKGKSEDATKSGSSGESKHDVSEEEVADGEEEDGQGKKKKEKKEKKVVVEANRPVADAILEMAAVFFKNGDVRKGGVFSKAAMALRDAETEIKSAKEAMALKGIGKGIAGYVEEFLETKMIVKLEELRAGTA